MADYYFNFQNTTIDNGSSGIHSFIAGNFQAASENPAALEELREICAKLEKTEPLMANAIANLEQAIREQDKPKISQIIQQLSIGTAASILADLASNRLLAFLGLR